MNNGQRPEDAQDRREEGSPIVDTTEAAVLGEQGCSSNDGDGIDKNDNDPTETSATTVSDGRLGEDHSGGREESSGKVDDDGGGGEADQKTDSLPPSASSSPSQGTYEGSGTVAADADGGSRDRKSVV